jgi:hypothetical protein
MKWLGPYQINRCYDNGFVKIRIYEDWIPLLVNGHRLKLYKKPLIKDEFISKFQEATIIESKVLW